MQKKENRSKEEDSEDSGGGGGGRIKHTTRARNISVNISCASNLHL